LLISPTRSFDWLDLVADIIGALIGIGLFRFIYGKEFFN
jgi:VanZ family protein